MKTMISSQSTELSGFQSRRYSRPLKPARPNVFGIPTINRSSMSVISANETYKIVVLRRCSKLANQ